MSHEQQLNKMRLEILGDVADNTKDEVFNLKLDDAEIVALNTLYPYDLTKTELDKTNKRLMNWQARCAIELYKAMERMGVQTYAENGLSVSFLSSLVSSELKLELTPPKAGVPR